MVTIVICDLLKKNDFKIVKTTFFNKLSNFINSSSGNVLKVKIF